MCLKRVIYLAVALAIGSGFGPRLLAEGTVSIGMTRAKVLETLGEPIGTLREGSHELLIFKAVEIRVVSNRVVRVNQLNGTLLPTGPAASPKSAPSPPPQPAAAARAAPVVAPKVTTKVVAAPVAKSTGTSFAKLVDGQTGKYRNCQFTPGQRTFFIGGFILFGAGFVVVMGGSIWLLVRAFVVHVGWGLACLFLPLANIVFLCCHWSEGRKPFFVSLAGAIGAVLGAYLAFGLGVVPAMATGAANSQSTVRIQSGSLANDILIRDAMPTIGLYTAGLGCKTPDEIKRIEVLRQPEGPTGGKRWLERWFITGCGKEFPVDLVFQEDGRGGAFFEVRAPK